MAKKSQTAAAGKTPLLSRAATGYRRLLINWGWVIPSLTASMGLISSVFSTKVFLALWGGMAVFSAVTVLTLLLLGRLRLSAGWVSAIVLLPFIGEVGVMSYALLLYAAGLYAATLAAYVVLAGVAAMNARRSRPVVEAPAA